LRFVLAISLRPRPTTVMLSPKNIDEKYIDNPAQQFYMRQL